MDRFCCVLPALLMTCAAAGAAGPYDDLLKFVPPGTNTLVLVNVKEAYASPRARAEKWAEEYAGKYRSGVAFVPPDTERLVVASDVNLTAVARNFQVALVTNRFLPSLDALAAREGGAVDEVAGRAVVRSSRDVYYVTPAATTLAAIYPADRQTTARWVRHLSAPKPVELSPYLTRAAAASGENTLVVAVDLADAVDPVAIKFGLPYSPAVVKNKVADVGRLARFLAGTKGLTFTARMTKVITGSVRVDFADDPAVFKNTLRGLFLELVEDHGIAVTGLDDWEVTFGPTSMTLTGPLATADLRRVMSLFAFPSHGGEDGSKPPGTGVSTAATKRYLAAVEAIVKDVRRTKVVSKYEKTATWHDKAAEQVEHLSRRGVDPTAVDAGYETAKRLRAIAGSLRGVPIDIEAIGRKGYYVTQPSWGVAVGWRGIRPVWTGGGSVQTNYPELQAKAVKVIAEDEDRRAELWSQIDKTISSTRAKLGAN